MVYLLVQLLSKVCFAFQNLRTTSSLLRRFEDMVKVFEANNLKPVIDSVFTWDEAEKAFAYLERQKHVSKVVIKVA